mmetsp:Transcript_24773/g.53439  ORF Transcript_24773/g.53439 Transcript_24773/m.53439 type:complete len:239 (-) Transcript_24773:136-852(-)
MPRRAHHAQGARDGVDRGRAARQISAVGDRRAHPHGRRLLPRATACRGVLPLGPPPGQPPRRCPWTASAHRLRLVCGGGAVRLGGAHVGPGAPHARRRRRPRGRRRAAALPPFRSRPRGSTPTTTAHLRAGEDRCFARAHDSAARIPCEHRLDGHAACAVLGHLAAAEPDLLRLPLHGARVLRAYHARAHRARGHRSHRRQGLRPLSGGLPVRCEARRSYLRPKPAGGDAGRGVAGGA